MYYRELFNIVNNVPNFCYIHLNPLRANLVKDLKDLDKYPWTGHSAILGRCKNPLMLALEKQKQDPAPVKSEGHLTGVKKEKSLAEKTIEDVLLYFGETFKVGRRRYCQFVEKE